MAHEFEYLTALTKNYVLAEHSVSEPPEGLDWSVFKELCRFHKVTGTLLPTIPRSNLSPEVCADLAKVQATTAQHTVLNLMFLERILPQLEGAGCQPIVLKGGVLATHYYQEAEHRFLADLDILVPSDQVDNACDVLIAMGLDFADTVANPEYYRNHHFHWIMSNDAGFVVEVHWDLTVPDSAFRFDLVEVRDRSYAVSLGMTSMRVLEPIDHLLHIVTQCIEGGFCELRRIIDAALLFGAVDNTVELARRAQARNQGTALWLLLNQVESWTGVRIPTTLIEELAPGTTICRLLQCLADKMLRGKDEIRHHSEIHHLLEWSCLPSLILRWEAIWSFLSPGKEYWLEQGYSPQKIPGTAKVMKLRLSRASTLFYLFRTAIVALLPG